MTDSNLEFVYLKSKDIGNTISKQLSDVKRETSQLNDDVQRDTPDGYVDYGNLPSRALPELGKQAAANKIDQKRPF